MYWCDDCHGWWLSDYGIFVDCYRFLNTTKITFINSSMGFSSICRRHGCDGKGRKWDPVIRSCPRCKGYSRIKVIRGNRYKEIGYNDKVIHYV